MRISPPAASATRSSIWTHLFSEHCDRLLTDEELEQYLKEHEDEYEREDDE